MVFDEEFQKEITRGLKSLVRSSKSMQQFILNLEVL